MTGRVVTLAIVLLMSGLSATLLADTLILKNGARIAGTVVRVSAGTIDFKDGQGVARRYPMDAVAAIEFDTAGAPRVDIKLLTITSGAILVVRTAEVIDSATSAARQVFSAVFVDPVKDGGSVLVPEGSSAQLVLREEPGARKGVPPAVWLDVESITVEGRQYHVRWAVPDGNGAGGDVLKPRLFGPPPVPRANIHIVSVGERDASISMLVGEGTAPGIERLPDGAHLRVPAGTLLMFAVDGTVTLHAGR